MLVQSIYMHADVCIYKVIRGQIWQAYCRRTDRAVERIVQAASDWPTGIL